MAQAKLKLYFNNTAYPTIIEKSQEPIEQTSKFVLNQGIWTNTAFNVAIILGLMVISTLISYFFLMHLSLRLDESQSLWQTSRSPAKLLQIVAQDVHVPLYHLSLHYWQIFLGNSVAVVRAFSLIFFVLTIPAIYLLGKEAYGNKVALFGATLVAFSPFLNWYGSETRMYSMLVFFTVLNQYFYLRLFKRPSTASWLGYAITAFFGMYTHYFFLLGLLCQIIFFFAFRNLFPKDAGKKFAIIALVLTITFLPWLYLVYKQGFASTTQPLLSRPTTVDLFNTFSQFLFGFQADHLNTILVSLWPLTMLLAIFGLHRDRRTGERRKVPAQTKYFLLSAIFPIVIIFVISFVKPLYLSRYLILTIPSLYLFIGWMLAIFPVSVRNTIKVVLIASMIATLAIQTVSAGTPVKEDYAAAVNYIAARGTPQDIIVLSAPFTIYPVEYYYIGPIQITTLPFWDIYAGGTPAFNSATLPSQVNNLKTGHKIAWVLFSQDQGYNQTIKNYLDANYQRIDQKTFSPGLELDAYNLTAN